MKIGIIGLGNMAQSMIFSLIQSGAISQENVHIYSRTAENIEKVTSVYPHIVKSNEIIDLVNRVDMVFVCVYTYFVVETIEKFYVCEFNKPVIYISPSISLATLEEKFKGIQVTMLIPTVASQGGAGVSLISSSSTTKIEHKKKLKELFGKFGEVREYYGSEMFLATVLSSCMPAFIAKIIETFEKEGEKLNILSPIEIREMVAATAIGVSSLILKQNWEPQVIQSMVATKGGITEKGLVAMEKSVTEMVDEIYRATLAKLGVYNAK